jgi:stalled ribosome rescue protein Dom34
VPATTDKFLLSAVAVEQLLASQELLNEQLKTLSLTALRQLLQSEMRGRRRVFFISRLHGRYTKLRAQQERAALLRGESWPL